MEKCTNSQKRLKEMGRGCGVWFWSILTQYGGEWILNEMYVGGFYERGHKGK